VAGTLVHAGTGLVPIEQTQVGDLVLSRHESQGERAYRRVIDVVVPPWSSAIGRSRWVGASSRKRAAKASWPVDPGRATELC